MAVRYTNQLPALVGVNYASPSQSELARLVFSRSKLTHVAARLVLNATIAKLTETEMKRTISKFLSRRNAVTGKAEVSSAAPKRKSQQQSTQNLNRERARMVMNDHPRSLNGLQPGHEQSPKYQFDATMVVPLIACVLHPQWAPPTAAKFFTPVIVQGLENADLEVHIQCLLIENFGKGFPVWRPYLSGNSVVDTMGMLLKQMVCGNSSLRTTSLRALLQMGDNSPILIIDLVRYCAAYRVLKCLFL